MSYEHCEIHDEDATNGCASCDILARQLLAGFISLGLKQMSKEQIARSLSKLTFYQLECLKSAMNKVMMK